MSRLLRFSYDIALTFAAPVREHAFTLRCLPPDTAAQTIRSLRLHLEPGTDYTIQRDGFGNRIQSGFLAEPHDHFHYSIRGLAVTDSTCPLREPAHPMYRFAAGHTAISPEASAFLAELNLPEEPFARAEVLSEAVHGAMVYRPGTTGLNTTAAQAFAAGQGVCQDFAHVFLMLARESGLPARYVNGLTVGEGASHAWCQVWADGCWRGIDPTRKKWTDDTYLQFNTGRDFRDCPLERGIFRGITTQEQRVRAVVEEI